MSQTGVIDLDDDDDEDDVTSTLHVTVSGGRPAPKRDVYVKMPVGKGAQEPNLVPLSKIEEVKDVAEEVASRNMFKSLRGVYRLYAIDALFIVETKLDNIPFDVAGSGDLGFELINQVGHAIYYATGKRHHPLCHPLFGHKTYQVTVFDFDGIPVCVFDMDKAICKYTVRIHSPAGKFGSIRSSGCTLRSAFFRIRNKHLRTDFLAYPLQLTRSWRSMGVPHEYVVMGVTSEAKVAHIGKDWPLDTFPIVAKRAVNRKGRMYGVVFEDHLMMFQKLNIIALCFAIKFIRQDFDKPNTKVDL